MNKLNLFESKVFRAAATLSMLGSISLTLSGCDEGEPQFKDGEATVVQHTYDDQDLISVKPFIVDPESFVLDLEQCGYEKNVSSEVDANGCKTSPLEVSETVYEDTADGDTVQLQTTTDGNVIIETIQ